MPGGNPASMPGGKPNGATCAMGGPMHGALTSSQALICNFALSIACGAPDTMKLPFGAKATLAPQSALISLSSNPSWSLTIKSCGQWMPVSTGGGMEANLGGGIVACNGLWYLGGGGGLCARTQFVRGRGGTTPGVLGRCIATAGNGPRGGTTMPDPA